MTFEEAVEANLDLVTSRPPSTGGQGLVTVRPFRAPHPHHLGGGLIFFRRGTPCRPARSRWPTGASSFSRASESARRAGGPPAAAGERRGLPRTRAGSPTMPARFMLLGAMNPLPVGMRRSGSGSLHVHSPAKEGYRRRVSGPPRPIRPAHRSGALPPATCSGSRKGRGPGRSAGRVDPGTRLRVRRSW